MLVQLVCIINTKGHNHKFQSLQIRLQCSYDEGGGEGMSQVLGQGEFCVREPGGVLTLRPFRLMGFRLPHVEFFEVLLLRVLLILL